MNLERCFDCGSENIDQHHIHPAKTWDGYILLVHGSRCRDCNESWFTMKAYGDALEIVDAQRTQDMDG